MSLTAHLLLLLDDNFHVHEIDDISIVDPIMSRPDKLIFI